VTALAEVDVFGGFGGPVLLGLPAVGRSTVSPSRGKRLEAGWTHKVCPGCGFLHDREEYRSQTRCRPCRAVYGRTEQRRSYRRAYYADNREDGIRKTAAWRVNNRERWLDANRKYSFGVPYGTYARMLVEQDGLCWICLVPVPEDKAFHMDHDHATGVLRRLLCDLCNRGLGYFRDEAALLREAADYLDSFAAMQTEEADAHG
jgi:Recombination endonuclease VII